MNPKSSLPSRYPELMNFKLKDNVAIKRNYIKYARYLNQVDFMIGVSDSVHDIFLYHIPTLVIDSGDNFFEKLDQTISALEAYDDFINDRNNFRQVVNGMKQILTVSMSEDPLEFVVNGLDFFTVPREHYKPEMDNLHVGGPDLINKL